MGKHVKDDDILFDVLNQKKKKRRRRVIITVVIVLVVAVAASIVGVNYLRQRVREQFAAAAAEVLSYEVSTGTISTVVSGAGTLSNVELESVVLPSGVEVNELLVRRNDTVNEGDVLATVNMSSVVKAMSVLQAQIASLDSQIAEAEEDAVDSYITAGVSGRVKLIYGEEGLDVADCMVEHGALAVLSLDGYMAVDVADSALETGDALTVRLADESEVSGSVTSSVNGTATVLVTDKGPSYGEEVTLLDDEGIEIGRGELYIHDPLSVTGFAGTVDTVYVEDGEWVDAGDNLFYLTDTGYSINYDSLLRTRSELEAELLKLLSIQRDGAVLAPASGSVYATDESGDGGLVTLSLDEQMSVTISVDESDILSLALGQTAQITVRSVSDDSFSGAVTQIDTSGTSGAYSAEITLDKADGMLSGMTARVEVMIEGVEDALLIPIDALHLTSTGAYVYTAYDEETEEYGGRVDVVTGLSNSNYVEIKSGLSEGDTVYYTEAQTFTNMFGGMGGFGSGSGGNSGGFGNMPGSGSSGGSRPSGSSTTGGASSGMGSRS